MANKIDPITGLQSVEEPKKPTLKTDPITGESYTPTPSGVFSARPQLITTQYSDNISKYQKYGVPLRQEFNWDEQRAQRQSTAEKWGHGLLKAGVTTVGAIADNTLGVLAGIGQAVAEGDSTKFYDNVVGRAVDKTNNWMQENLPNYYTEAERESSALQSLGYANFWADKVANGLGYAIGSIGTVYLTGGAGLATRGIEAASKGLKSYRAAKAISSGAKAEETIRRGAMAGRAKNAIQTAEIGMMMSYGESSVEARDVLNRTTERLMEERARELGVTTAQLPTSELREIRDTAAHAANVTFGLNLGVLSATNLVTFGKMLLPRYTAMRPAVKGITRSAKGQKFVDRWSTDPLWKTTAQRYLKDPVTSGLSETFQEGTQFAIQEAADRISTGGKGSVSDWTEALIEGYGETFDTKEGQESMMLGFIVGGLMGGASSFRQRLNKAEEDKERKKIVDALNTDSFVNTVDSAQSLIRAMEASQKMQAALEAGDHKAYRDAQFDLIVQQVAFHDARGSMDLFMEKIEDASTLSDTEFAKAFGIPDGVKFDKAEIISGVKSKIKDYQTLKEQIDAQFPSQPKQGVDRLFMTKEDKKVEEDQLEDERFYKSLLLNYGLNLGDSNKRITSLIEEVNELRSQAGPVKEGEELTEEDFNIVEATLDKEDREKTQSLQEKLNEIVDKVSTTNPLFGEQAREKINDIQRLSAERDIARSALKELYAEPETRARAIQREKQAEIQKEQDTRDAVVREKMEESPTSDHIAELIKSPEISDALKQELNGEYNSRKSKEDTLSNELYYSTLEQVEEMLEKEQDPFVQNVLRKHIAHRKETGEVNAREREKTEKEKSREEQRAEQKKKREEEKEALRNKHKEDAEEVESTTADTVTPSEQTAEGEKVSVVAGEFGTDASNKNIVVDENGGVTIGNDSNQPATIDRTLSKKEGLEGKEVELRLLDAVERDGEQFQSVGVFVGNTLIGVLGRAKADKIAPRLRAGETIKGKVAQRYFNNVTNLRDQNGEPVFTQAAEALKELEGFVGYAVYTGEQYDFGDQKGVEEARNALNKGTRAEITGLAPGQVVLVVKLPNGEFKPVAVSTNPVGEGLVNTAIDLLSQGTLQGIIDARELLGITEREDKPNVFFISPTGEIHLPYNGGDIVITPTELIQLRDTNKVEGKPELNEDVYKALRETIANLKLQVKKSNLGIDNTYISPQTEKSYPTYRDYIENEVVRVDFKVIDGSIFFDIGVVIELGGQAKEEVIESLSFEEETPTPTDSTTQEENSGKEPSSKFGDGLLRLDGETETPVDLEKAKAWLIDRFGEDVGIVVFNNLQKVGDSIVHGYMENGAIHLYKNAEVGTEYHEAFHLFFRGLLTDEQRQSLYEDAVAIYGEPTKDDIENARRGKPNLSNKEARLLAIEEKLAEEFRTYTITEQAPKTLGAKILKFFKDLFAYIKALSTDRVSVRQAFRLLEGNRIPKSFSRNMQSMSPGRAYMLKEYTQTPRLHKEKVDLILYNTLNLLDSGSFTVEELLGDIVDKQSMLADWFLRHAISKEEGTPVSEEEFKEFKKVYDSATEASQVVAVMKKLGVKVSPPNTNSLGSALPAKTAGNRKNGMRFLAIYDYWFDQESELGGLPVRGFRSEVLERLKTDFGYKVVDKVVVDTESDFERIFGISRMKEEPAKKLSQKAKRALSRIPVQNLGDSFFGFQTYIPITDVFTELSGAVADSSSFQDMLENLKQQKNSVNSLNAVYDFIVGLEAEEQALLYSTLALGMNAHRVLIVNETEDGAETMLFSPVQSTIKKYFTNKWKNAAVGGKGVYKVLVDDNGGFKGLSVDKGVAQQIQEKAKIVFDGIESPGNKELEAFSDALWLMGITLGKNEAESRDRVREVFSLDGKYKQNLEAFIKDTQLKNIMTEMFSPDKTTYTNVFETESTTIGKIADTILSKFESPKAASFLGGTGSMIYALNLKSDLTITKEMVQSGEYGEMYLNAIGHSTNRVSSIGTILLNNLNYQEIFEPIDLDVSKIVADENDDVKEYSNMTYEDTLVVALNMAFPAKGNVRYIALDTQADRDRLTFIPIPKIEDRRVKGLFDLNQGVEQGNEPGSIIKNYILLDLHRMGKELTMEGRDEMMTYHTKERFRAFQVGGELSPEQDKIAIDAASYMDNPNVPMSEDLKEFLDNKVGEVVENINQYYNDIVSAVGGESNLIKLVQTRVDKRSYIKGNEIDLVRRFVTQDMIGRLISREIFRGGVNHVKDGADYNKRSALTTTPGTVLMIAGDSVKDPNYGMSPTFNELTVKDIITSLDKEQLERLKKVLSKQVGEKEAAKIAEAYTRSNSTDAQAFISPSMYRNIRMGMGLWTKEDQGVYENYLETGVWSGKIMPLKPSYEFRGKHQGRIVPISHKNSYMVLTRELAEGNPSLTTLLDRMEAVGEFEGLAPIDVVNMESAKKTGGFAPVDAQSVESLSTAPVMTLDSRGLKFPQIIPEKSSFNMTFGRQPRKNMVANLDRTDKKTYTIDGVKISGNDLFDLYQSAIVAKLNKNRDKVFERLGYDKVIEATTAEERAKALNDLLPKLQEFMLELGVEKDYPQNILDALEIVRDEDGNLSTALPLAFPSVQSKLEQLLFGMFRREIYQQKMLGMEMVQFSEFGGAEEASDLKFYDIEGGEVVVAEVDIRYDVLERLGIDPSTPKEQIDEKLMTLVGYRIPQQGKSSTLVMKVRNILPASHQASVKVPGAITTMMGSDFDIDKMYVLFPEAVKKGNRAEKVAVDYNSLKDVENINNLSIEQLNNVIFDTLVAVATNPIHLSESIAPLEITDIEAAREAIGKSKEDIDINNPSTRIQTGIDNMLSGILRGLYANGIAGRNVVTATKVLFTENGVTIDGKSLGAIVEYSPFTNRPTDYYLSQYLSAAVDSVKDPIQAAINDNALTAPLTIYMMSIGMTPTQAVAFLNVPAVKSQIDAAVKNGVSLAEQLVKVKADNSLVLSTQEMLAIISGEKSKYPQSSYIKLLKHIADKSRKLDNLYRAVSPDAIDRAGTIPQHLDKLDKKNAAEGGNASYGGVDALNRITDEDEYLTAKAYYDIIEQSLSLGGDLGFISNQEGVTRLKKFIMYNSERKTLTEAMHRDINRAILHHLVTAPGSPIFESDLLLETRVMYNHMQGGLETLLNDMKKIVGGESNIVLEALELEAAQTPKGEFVRYILNSDKVVTTLQKNYFTATLKGMMDNPALYGEENKATVEKFIEAVVSNSIVTSGFAPSPKSTFELIPVEYFKRLGVGAHLTNQIKNLNEDPNLLVTFLPTFLKNYGHHKFGGEYLFRKPFKGVLRNTVTVPNRTAPYMVASRKDKKTGVITSALYVLEDPKNGVYRRVQTKGQQRLFYEAHLKRENGSAVSDESSLINDSISGEAVTNSSRLTLEQKETPTGAAEKIALLKKNFADAGIDVTVVEAELPPGEKGQVIGDLIILDPNQMDADTVYHEFGHILVDMLPQDEVDKYIAQVEKLNPELAEMVRNNYPELKGRELGKEILVTAIGLEGAKITRKSPSKIQRIINKIMRALGKLFGVQPNAAAMLAEQMFAGEIRNEYLSGKFNPKVQKSKSLQDDITKTFEEVSVSLKRQLIRLENLPESEKTRSRIREIKTLQKNLTKMEDNMSDINQFLNFQQYVVGRVDKLEVLMDKMYNMKDRKLSRQEALDLLRTVGEIRETIDSLYSTEKNKSTVHKMKRVLRNIPFGESTSLQVAEIKYDLQDSLDRLEDLEQDYQDIILPLVADTLVTYGDESINDSIDKEIERVRREKDISDFRRFSFLNKNPEYLALKKKKNDMSPEEYRDAMVEVKVNSLKSKRIGRDQIIAELRDAHTSKKKFSLYLDPMVYSNEANLQLFALSIKDAINNANEKSRGFLFQLDKQYSKFKEWKGGDFNEAKFNEDLLTTVTITRGDGSTIELLSLVQEYDVDAFYKSRDAEIARLNKAYNKPKEFSELSEWRKSSNGKLHREALSKWYKDNTEAAPNAKKILSELRSRKESLIQQANALPESDLDTKNILLSEISDLTNKIISSYRSGVYMGDLAVPSKKYKSLKYEKIQNTPELKAYYDFLVKSFQASQKKIGKSELFINSWDKYSYIMPSVRKDRLAFVQQEGWRELAKESVQDLQRLDTDTQFGVMTNADGGRVQSIPRFYTNMVEQKNVSRDIASSMAQFTHMANTFEEKSNVTGLVEAMMTLHENRQTLAVDSKTGLPLIDEISRRVTKKDNSYVLKPGVENNAYQHLKEFVDSVFYGQFDIDNTGPLGVSLSKVAGKAAAFTATANLAFNTLQIGNQFILDNLMGSEEAVAGQFYGKADFAWAAKTYAAEKGALGDVGKFVPKSKLGQAMQMFDALNEVSDTIGEQLTGNKLKKAMQSDPFFALQHAVEHQSTGVRMLALLHATKVADENNKPILNEDGGEANLWDMLIKDDSGKLIIDPRVKNVDRNAFIAKLHGINKRANQVKGSFDRSMGSRRAIGKLLLLFRNYFIPGLRKRFGHGDVYHVDHELGDVTRGMYLTVTNYIGNIIEGRGISSSYQMMSETDKQNFKRAVYEASAAMSTAVIFGVLNSMIDMDDDDEDSYALVYAAYQARRLQTELLQFVSLGEFVHLAKSPMATVNWVGKYIDLIDQVTVKEPGYALGLVEEDEIFYQRATGTAEKGDRKVFNKVRKVLPILNGWQTSFVKEGGEEAVKEKLRWFNQ